MLDREALALLEEWERRESTRLFPDFGPLRRELYPKHLQFFKLGATKPIRGFIAANRVGKTTAACLELSFHLTGEYPHWWEGKRFDGPIEAWAASIDWKDIREGIQAKLFGKETDIGSGIIPSWAIDPKQITYVGNTNGAIDKALIRHKSGGWSELQFKTYKAGRDTFQAVSRHVILLDEDPIHFGIFSECVTRTATVDGIVMLSFTSIRGVTPLVMKFLPELGKPPEIDGEEVESEGDDIDAGFLAAVICGWDDVPHLPEKMRKVLLSAYNEQEKKVRTTGWPGLSAGMVYPVEESEFVVQPFAIPKHWPRVCGLDPGWNRTAAVWLAIDPDTDTAYVTSEHYRSKVAPEVHARGILARGDWIPVVSDNAKDLKGNSIIDEYKALGLKKIVPAKKSGKDVRLMQTHSRLSSGRLKVFSTCPWWLWEFRQYRTNESGEIASDHDHLMNATEYAVESGIPIAEVFTPPPPRKKLQTRDYGLHFNA
jgi:phage terminase large subunit-like protein